jgi:hypothetical protein
MRLKKIVWKHIRTDYASNPANDDNRKECNCPEALVVHGFLLSLESRNNNIVVVLLTATLLFLLYHSAASFCAASIESQTSNSFNELPRHHHIFFVVPSGFVSTRHSSFADSTTPTAFSRLPQQTYCIATICPGLTSPLNILFPLLL